MIDRLPEKLISNQYHLQSGILSLQFMHIKKRSMPNHPSTYFYPNRLAVNAITWLPKPKPNPKTGFDLSQNRKTGFTKGTRFWKPYGLHMAKVCVYDCPQCIALVTSMNLGIWHYLYNLWLTSLRRTKTGRILKMRKFSKIAHFRAPDSPSNMRFFKVLFQTLRARDLPCEDHLGPIPFTSFFTILECDRTNRLKCDI